jgi:SpoVK/Ycf46/Vps4 family AAA+-type ATPase
LSEELRRPLYSVSGTSPLADEFLRRQISSGDLSLDSTEAEKQLTHIFDLVYSWGAILLMDEADAYLRRRTMDPSDRLITMFLRRLEYFKGIMILTTNRITDFDDAMQSRIHLAYKFPELGRNTRETLWVTFLDRVGHSITGTQIAKLAEERLNGRQVGSKKHKSEALANLARSKTLLSWPTCGHSIAGSSWSSYSSRRL